MKNEFYACVARSDVADGQGEVFTTDALRKAARQFFQHQHLPVTARFDLTDIIGVVEEVIVGDRGMWIRGHFTREEMSIAMAKQMSATHVFRISFVPKAWHVVEGCRVYDDVDVLQIGFLPADEAVPLTKETNT